MRRMGEWCSDITIREILQGSQQCTRTVKNGVSDPALSSDSTLSGE